MPRAATAAIDRGDRAFVAARRHLEVALQQGENGLRTGHIPLHGIAEHSGAEILADSDARILGTRAGAKTAAGHSSRHSQNSAGQFELSVQTDQYDGWAFR